MGAVRLRLFSADDSTSPITLREIYDSHLLPSLRQRKAATRQGYLDALSHWERITHNPPVQQIDADLMLRFQQALIPGRSAQTVNKIMRTLHPLIVRTWPREMRNLSGLGLCELFAWPTALPVEETEPRVYSAAEVDALYAAAEVATWPHVPGIPAPRVWQTMMVCHYTAGPRTYDLGGWEWEKIRWDEFEFGSVSFVAKKRTKLHRLPLHEVAAAHLRSIEGDWTQVFPGFRRSNKSNIAKHWKRICAAAGVVGVMEDFRKTCDTAYEDHSEGVGQWILGHSRRGVNARNYYNPTSRIVKAVATLPVPESFRRGAERLA